MKYLRILFLYCALNACNLDKDKTQHTRNYEALKIVDEEVFLNYICLDTLRMVGKKIEYNIENYGQPEILFVPDCSTENLNRHKQELIAILNKKFNEHRMFTIKAQRQENLKNKPDFCKNISTFLNINENDDQEDIVKYLVITIKQFFIKNENFWVKLKTDLGIYRDKVKDMKVRDHVDSFIKLSECLLQITQQYNAELKNIQENKSIISFFFLNFFVQYYNVYYENILRVTQNNPNGEQRIGLCLMDAIV